MSMRMICFDLCPQPEPCTLPAWWIIPEYVGPAALGNSPTQDQPPQAQKRGK